MTNTTLPWRHIQEQPKPGIICVWCYHGDTSDFETNSVEALPYEFGSTAQRWLQLYEDPPDPFEVWRNDNTEWLVARRIPHDEARVIFNAGRKVGQ